MIRVGAMVRDTNGDGPWLSELYGPAVVLAVDGEWPGNPPNRPAAWIRFTTEQGVYIYRSVDQEDLEAV